MPPHTQYVQQQFYLNTTPTQTSPERHSFREMRPSVIELDLSSKARNSARQPIAPYQKSSLQP